MLGLERPSAHFTKELGLAVDVGEVRAQVGVVRVGLAADGAADGSAVRLGQVSAEQTIRHETFVAVGTLKVPLVWSLRRKMMDASVKELIILKEHLIASGKTSKRSSKTTVSSEFFHHAVSKVEEESQYKMASKVLEKSKIKGVVNDRK